MSFFKLVTLATLGLFTTHALLAQADYCDDNKLNYRYKGGPLQTEPVVYNIYVGRNFTNTVVDQNNAYLQTLTSDNSPYFDWLCEYNTESQRFGKPSYGGFARNTEVNASTSLTLTNLRDLVVAHIQAGEFPTPVGTGLNQTFIVYLSDFISFSDVAVGRTCRAHTEESGFCTEHVSVPFSGDVTVASEPSLFIGIVSDLTQCYCDGMDIRPKAARVLLNTITNPTVTYWDRDGSVPAGWIDQCRHDISSVTRCHDAGPLTLLDGTSIAPSVTYGWSNVQGKCVAQLDTPVCGPFKTSPAPHTASIAAAATVMAMALTTLALLTF